MGRTTEDNRASQRQLETSKPAKRVTNSNPASACSDTVRPSLAEELGAHRSRESQGGPVWEVLPTEQLGKHSGHKRGTPKRRGAGLARRGPDLEREGSLGARLDLFGLERFVAVARTGDSGEVGEEEERGRDEDKTIPNLRFLSYDSKKSAFVVIWKSSSGVERFVAAKFHTEIVSPN